MKSQLIKLRPERFKKRPGFSILELILSLFIISIIGGVVASTINKSYLDNRLVESQSVTQRDLYLAEDRLARILRSTTTLLEATETNLKIRGYPSASDTAPSEINFYLQNSALKFSVIPPTGSPPNYTYNQGDAKYYTLLAKTTNSVANPVFRYYDGSSALLGFPVAVSSIRVVETNLSALDAGNTLKSPIIVTTKITLRNFKTNL